MKDIKSAILLFIALTAICGGLYPALVTAVAQTMFPEKAGGSFFTGQDNREIGSRLIGQGFSGPRYFWPRPSATADFGYNPAASGGSNLGPSNPAYLSAMADRVRILRETGVTGDIPADLVQASASGLDPHLSPEAALAQIPRVARARGLNEDDVRKLVAANTEGRQFGFLGAPRVTVLTLNAMLDALDKNTP